VNRYLVSVWFACAPYVRQGCVRRKVLGVNGYVDGIERPVVLTHRRRGMFFAETDKTDLPAVNIEVMTHLEFWVLLDGVIECTKLL